jgi:hypothetical protein
VVEAEVVAAVAEPNQVKLIKRIFL